MKFGFRTYRTELITVVTISFTMAILIIAIFTYKLYNAKFNELSEETATSVCRDFAAKLSIELNSALITTRTLANAFESGKIGDEVVNLNREEAISILDRELKENPNFFSVFSLWEPGAFDNEDKMYSYQPGSSESGCFIPHLFRNDSGQVVLQSLANFDSRDVLSYYHQSKKTLNEYIANPKLFKFGNIEKWIISFVTPIVYNYKFYGVVGVDLSSEYLKDILSKSELFDNTAKIELISPEGRYAAATTQDSLVGYSLDYYYKDFSYQKTQIQNGVSSVDEKNDTLVIKLPLTISRASQPWQLRFYVPKNKLVAISAYDLKGLFFIGLILCILCIVIVLFYMRQIFNPLTQFAAVSQKIITGDLTGEINLPTRHELTKVKNAYNEIHHVLKNLIHICRAITQGDFSHSIESHGEHDELANSINDLNQHLKNARQQEIKRDQEIKIRNWIREGLAELSDILRVSNSDIELLSLNVVKMIVNYLNAEQGAIFLLNTSGKEPYLELSAAIAYDKKKYLDKKILLGEGLLGACALERETIYLTKLPEGYVEITSGMGHSIPKSLLLIPLKIENKVVGVIEIASVRTMEKHHIGFVERSSDSIALTISSSIANQKTAKLLDQSKHQAEELSAQEEEMRQNLEELEATQEESHRKELEMKGILMALDTSFMVAEIDMDGFYLKVNPRYCDVFGMDKEMLIGRNHNEYTLRNSDSEDFYDFWSDLNKAKIKVVEEKISMPSGREFWLTEIYTPILDNSGLPAKVLKIAYDITKIKEQELKISESYSKLQTKTEELIHINNKNNLLVRAIDESVLEIEFENDGFITRVNSNYLNVTHLKAEEILNKNIFDILPVKERKELKAIWTYLMSGQTVHVDIERTNQLTSEPIYIKMNYIPALNVEGKVQRILAIGTDVTQYKQKELEAIQKLEELSKKGIQE